ncbi:MAG: hypothetical protein ACE5H3_07460, partial [Planctomycetota bacterium]
MRATGFLLLLASTACAGPSWTTLESARVRCHVESALPAALPARLAAWARDDLQALSTLVGELPPSRPVDLFCASREGCRGHLAVDRGETGRHVRLAGPACRIDLLREADPAALRSNLRHELTHHLLEDCGFPPWLDEGLAEWAAFSLAARPAREDCHNLLHSGPVLAAWGFPGGIPLSGGGRLRFRSETWLPDLVAVVRATRWDDPIVFQEGLDGRPPEFHAVAHLLVRMLLEKAGPGSPGRVAGRLRKGEDPWTAYRELT